MQKTYTVPQTEVMQLNGNSIMDSIGIVRHSGGTNTGGKSGFDESEIW